jgi:recombinational DNA repair protein (RecF pathway)
MIEHFTEALVLDTEDSGELDKIIYLYTKELGKVAAKAKSVRKITSKLTGHLQPLNLARVRLVEKNNFQVVDALCFKKMKASGESVAFLQFIKDMTFELQTDKKFWLVIKKIFHDFKAGSKISYRSALKVLGFDPDFAHCDSCGTKKVVYFLKSDQMFFCGRCGFKIPKDELVLI